VRDLVRKSSSQQAIAALGRALAEDKFWAVRREAALAIGTIKTDQALSALLEAPPDSDSRIRAAVISALGSFDGNQKAIAAVQKAWTADDSYRVGVAVMQAIARVKAPDASDILQAGLSRASYGDFIAQSALAAMATLPDKRAIPLAIEESKPGKPSRLRQTAIQVLGVTGKQDESAFQAVEAAAHDPFGLTRGVAYTTLGQMGNLKALPVLKEAASSEPDPDLRATASQAIAALTAPPPSSAELLQQIRELREKNIELERRLNALEQKH
ncbi:MAG TPA: HEAT repeat domain-containing protein, partial [Blastocatellia bacterium]